jgi:hypothetical protein
MLRKILPAIILFAGLIFIAAPETSAQSVVRVKFAKNKYEKTLIGRITGYSYIDYVVRVDDGQFLDVVLKSANKGLSFVITDPNGQPVEGGMDKRDFVDIAQMKGDFKIRVLQPRASARRGTAASFSIRISAYYGT